jgi:hypothetical protein
MAGSSTCAFATVPWTVQGKTPMKQPLQLRQGDCTSALTQRPLLNIENPQTKAQILFVAPAYAASAQRRLITLSGERAMRLFRNSSATVPAKRTPRVVCSAVGSSHPASAWPRIAPSPTAKTVRVDPPARLQPVPHTSPTRLREFQTVLRRDLEPARRSFSSIRTRPG